MAKHAKRLGNRVIVQRSKLSPLESTASVLSFSDETKHQLTGSDLCLGGTDLRTHLHPAERPWPSATEADGRRIPSRQAEHPVVPEDRTPLPSQRRKALGYLSLAISVRSTA
jgi:hypothetical protein